MNRNSAAFIGRYLFWLTSWSVFAACGIGLIWAFHRGGHNANANIGVMILVGLLLCTLPARCCN